MSGWVNGVDDRTADLIGEVTRAVVALDPGGLLGLYLYGSATQGGLTPSSDIDLLVVSRRSLTEAERAELVAILLPRSGWRGHKETFPEAVGKAPLEVTVIVVGPELPSPVHGCIDFQFGEWLRKDLVTGWLPAPEHDPDAVVLVATALAGATALHGPELSSLLEPVDDVTLRGAVWELVPSILDGIAGDERNALLTLARMFVTLETGGIVGKSAAALEASLRLASRHQLVMERARQEYLTGASSEWVLAEAEGTAQAIVELAQSARSRQP